MNNKKKLVVSIILTIVIVMALCLIKKSQSSIEDTSYDINSSTSSSTFSGSSYDESEVASMNDSMNEVEIQTSEKIVNSSYINIQTLEYSKTRDNVEKLMKKYDCILSSETEWNNHPEWNDEEIEEKMSAQIQLKVPSKDFYTFIDELNNLEKIISKQISTDNITKEYNEKTITIESLEIQKDRLLELMKGTKSISEMLDIESRLTEVETKLNTYKAELDNMDNNIEYSTISINIEEVSEYSKTKGKTFFTRLKDTIEDSWEEFLSILESGLFLIIMLLPYIVIGIIVFIIIKKIRKKKLEKKKLEKDE